MKDGFFGPFEALAKVAGWIVLFLLVVLILRTVGPAAAARFFRGLFHDLGGIWTFFKDLFGIHPAGS
jgi:hypothetical protein